MKPIITSRLAAGMACGLLAVFSLNAKTGAPHTFKVQPNFTDVTLSWEAPEAAKELRWHSGRDYNGDAAEQTDSQKAVKTWAASKFTTEDLNGCIGETVEAIKFFQYRPVFKTTVYVYENGETVATGSADPAAYEKNTWHEVKLDRPVKLAEGKEYMFVVCHEHGSNMDFIAIKDEAANAKGKGDLFSTDGVNWVATGGGEYLISAVLANDCDEAPKGYNVYNGDKLLNAELLTDVTTASFADQPAGENVFTVSAVYDNEEVKSYPVTLTLTPASSYLPSVNWLSANVDMLDVSLEWAAPLLGGSELTWSTSKEMGMAIGGTASKDTKVWVRNQFTGADLIAFAGGKISAVNFYFAEAVISGVTVYILKDGVIDHFEEMSEDAVSAIKEKEWAKFTLTEPYQIESGHDYAYGIYVLHTPKAHPMAVDNGTTIDVKGNSFSTSSPNSKDFALSKPSWKTLRSGGYEGNWMMTADIEGAPAAIAEPAYEVFRNGVSLATVTEPRYTDTVDDLGSYTYSIVCRSDDKVSMAADRAVNVKLPAAYSAPLIENTSFSAETKELSITWNMDKEISHCGDPYALASFDEEMALMWGTQFTAEELAAFKGYTITKLKFMIGEETGDLKVGVYTNKGVALSEVEIPAGTLKAQAIYTLKLDTPVEVTGESDLYLAYSAVVPAGVGAIVIDEGPLADGGAKISLSNGLNWLNLSTLNPAYAKYNIFISAMASEGVASTPDTAPVKEIDLGTLKSLTLNPVAADRVYGVETNVAVANVPVLKVAAPVVDHFNVYANGEKVAETKDYAYTETVSRFASFDYWITSVFTNGWESAPSQTTSFTNRIAQKGVAPYGLKGTKDGNDLKLEWESPEKSTLFTYVPDELPELNALKFSGSGSVYSFYGVVGFPAEETAAHIGKKLTHVQYYAAHADNIQGVELVVMAGEHVIYSQSVPVSSVAQGLNEVRLNEPVEITPAADFRVGFRFEFKSTENHPLAVFACEDHAGYGDIVSSSGSAGYWYSLHTKYSLNYCWYVKAIFAEADNTVGEPARAASRAAAVSYNVYRDGVLIGNVSEPAFTVKGAEAGNYCVTALSEDKESAESNSVAYVATTGIEDNLAGSEASVVYDRAAATISLSAEGEIEVFATNGSLVAKGNGTSLSVAALTSGIYTVRVTTADGVIVKKIVK